MKTTLFLTVLSLFAAGILVGCEGANDDLHKQDCDSAKVAKAYFKHHPDSSSAYVTVRTGPGAHDPTELFSKGDSRKMLDGYKNNPKLFTPGGDTVSAFVFAGPNFRSFMANKNLSGIIVNLVSNNGNFSMMMRGLKADSSVIDTVAVNERGQVMYSLEKAPPPPPPYSSN